MTDLDPTPGPHWAVADTADLRARDRRRIEDRGTEAHRASLRIDGPVPTNPAAQAALVLACCAALGLLVSAAIGAAGLTSSSTTRMLLGAVAVCGGGAVIAGRVAFGQVKQTGGIQPGSGLAILTAAVGAAVAITVVGGFILAYGFDVTEIKELLKL